MSMRFQLTQFEGPLDLLLSLIEEKKMDITEVAISEVTEQFLSYLDAVEEKAAEEMADFLVIAARLLLIKSKRLLDIHTPDEDDGPTLEEQLRLYRAFVKASHIIQKNWLKNEKSVFRVEPPRKPTAFVFPDNFGISGLHKSMVQLLRRLTPPKPLQFATIDKAVSLKEKIDHIRALLKSVKSVNFSGLLKNANNRTEVIVSFLALLELVKQHDIKLEQGDAFGDIMVKRMK